jgi:hypothetical protein
MRRCTGQRFHEMAGLLLLCVSFSGRAARAQTASTQSAMEASSSVSRDVHPRLGYSQDWSSKHLLMPDTSTEVDLSAGSRDPRYIYNVLRRQRAGGRKDVTSPPLRHRRKIDWAVSLENGYVPANQFPSKYRFNIGTDNCTSDYIVFGLTVTSGTQANLVGVNNLYTNGSPACNAGSPWVAFAYNTVTHTGGQIATSPVLSLDGTKVAFVESTSSASYFHVLVVPNPIPSPPSQAGSVLSPQTPTSCTNPTTPGCMTTLLIESGATNSNSSPWVDYNADIAYVGADNGKLYKIGPIFGGGAPALVNDPGNWPVTVSNPSQSNTVLTGAIEDTTAGRLYLGDGYGYLYAVNLVNPVGTYSAIVTTGWVGFGAGTGVVDAPLVVTDPAKPATDQVFVFTGCSIVPGIGGAVSQVAANFTNSTTLTTSNTVDLGSGHGNGDCTSQNVHSGDFDNAFWVNGSATGHLLACGFVSGTSSKPLIPSNPKMYFFPFASNVITSTGSSTFVVNNTLGDECSPLTEFYDGTTDRLFFGVGSTDGYLESSKITSSLAAPNCSILPTSACVAAPNALGGTSGIVVDNDVANGGENIYFSTMAPGSVNHQNCSVTGGAANPYCAVQLTQSALH